MSDARTLILLNEKRGKQSEPWNSTRGIYADFADGFDKPKYYCKCPKCQFVHGFYKTPREAIMRKLCNLCRFKDLEKLKKEVHQIAFAESEEDIDPSDYVKNVFDWEAELKRLGFHYLHPGWHKRRADHYWVSAEYTDMPQRVKVVIRDTRRRDVVASVTVPEADVVRHVQHYMKQSRVREEVEDVDPTAEIDRHMDWQSLLQRLGFVYQDKDDLWIRDYTNTGPNGEKRKYRIYVTKGAHSWIGVQSGTGHGDIYWLSGSGYEWVHVMELERYFRLHYPWLVKALSETDTDLDPKDYIEQAYDWTGDLKQLGFVQQPMGIRSWSKKRQDGHRIEVYDTTHPRQVKIDLVDRSSPAYHNRVIKSWPVAHPSVGTFVRQLLTCRGLPENEEIDPTEFVHHATDWQSLLRRLGFTRLQAHSDAYVRQWTGDSGRVWQTEIDQASPGYVGLRNLFRDKNSKHFWASGNTEWIPTIKLESWLRTMHPSWFTEGLSHRLVGHLLA